MYEYQSPATHQSAAIDGSQKPQSLTTTTAIKTQPYDLLRWSFEYFRALAEHRAPPVKLRLEYPIYSTEGGLTRGCLKVLANQMYGMTDVPTAVVKRAWQGFCLDHMELKRILCLCEMYRFLAQVDASKDVQYHNGYREGAAPAIPVMELVQDDGEDQEAADPARMIKVPNSSIVLDSEKINVLLETPAAERKEDEGHQKSIEILVFDEEDQPVKLEIYGEPRDEAEAEELFVAEPGKTPEDGEEVAMVTKSEKLALFLCKTYEYREQRLEDLEQTFSEIATIVDKFKTANYDLGMVAGRQMSTTSGEFIVQTIEKEIMDYIDEQIAILPDPDLKKKKAKPEEVAMIRDILEQFLDDNMEIIVPEVEEIEEEETPIPEITMVYAVPGIGGPVDKEIMADFEEFIKEVCKLQAEMVMPRNIRHFLCPPLEKYVEHDYTEFEPPKPEVTTGSKPSSPKKGLTLP
ncbi:hypothetical protein B5X24_HaOG213944 [Helicoverpa armigera]|uniref:Uncharacterized protein n=1 Tax=Helicoverpa armigera TaxID=29058 RepID=A0A2W1BBE9_HELAM|nr:hypothetical protein B5X24_HaOG213944 [Helicoverpa armigera]